MSFLLSLKVHSSFARGYVSPKAGFFEFHRLEARGLTVSSGHFDAYVTCYLRKRSLEALRWIKDSACLMRRGLEVFKRVRDKDRRLPSVFCGDTIFSRDLNLTKLI